MRVLAALSGGVDSAVAAARAVDAGHDVTAVHLALSTKPRAGRDGARGCCTLDDERDARRIADVLGVPYDVWDLAERFRADVIDDFVAEYAAGRTPNPCMRCNEQVKFSAVLDKALALGFDAVCTGHYARLSDDVLPAGGVVRRLRRGLDPDKDQSYVLGGLTTEQLAHSLFPLGESRKDDVRRDARDRGLAVAAKPDSYDVCFIPDGDTAGFLAGRLGDQPGTVVDQTGAEVGRHDGTYRFTVGQRRGLHLGVPAPDGRPRYVLGITPATGTVRVGPREALDVSRVVTGPPTWAGPAPSGSSRCHAQLRAHGAAVPATAVHGDDRLEVTFDKPARGVAPGQSLVLYDGDVVLGAARITAAADSPVTV